MRIRYSAGRAVVLLAALVSTGCATKGDLRNIQTEMRSLAVRQDSLMAELRRQNLSTRDTIRQASDQLFQIRGDVGSRLERIDIALERLTELVGQNQRTMASIRDQMESGGRRPMVGGGGDLGLPVTGGGSPADAVESYNAAVQAYNRGSYSAARFGFDDFINTFSSDDLVPDAYFFLGESLVQLQEPEEAIRAYEQVQQLFPLSDKVPNAMLGIGLTHIDQGDTTEARIILTRLVETYGDSDVAAQAREALAGLGGLRLP
jgi:tol-pal system protein YbgF